MILLLPQELPDVMMSVRGGAGTVLSDGLPTGSPDFGFRFFIANFGHCCCCHMQELPDVLMSVHGGAGAVLSIGLLNAIPLDRMERCLRTANHTSGPHHEALYPFPLRAGTSTKSSLKILSLQ